VVERQLARAAFDHLTVDALLALPFEALGPTKALLKRFFSAEPWGTADEEALAAAVGPGEGEWRRHLDADLVLDYGWHDGRFRLRIASSSPGESDGGPRPTSDDPLSGTFDGPVVPEATPNPRTIRFHVGAIHGGPSRWYESAADVHDDPGVARLFGEFDEVANVLVGPDFVAVGLRRAADWERLLRPVLAVVTEELAPGSGGGDAGAPRTMGGPAGAGATPAAGADAGDGPGTGHRLSRIDAAWRDLGGLRPTDAADLVLVEEAAAGDDPFRRQVAASLLREADPGTAAAHWARLVGDPARSVRRVTVDTLVDAGRQELRPLLEAALSDSDPWVRWKALRGLGELGPGPSRDAIEAHADDPDFRVRLEVAAALRAGGP
jgi:hypothetical protein